MKRFRIMAVSALLLAGCLSLGEGGGVSLDAAIEMASGEINEGLSEGTKIAILNFSSASDQFSDYVIEELSLAMVKSRKLVIVARREIELLRQELNFQLSGEVNEESAQEIGQILGAQYIVSGSVLDLGGTYRFRVKTINVASASIEVSTSVTVRGDEQISYLITGGNSGNDNGAYTAAGGTRKPGQAAEAAKYKVGDTGPAGGLIFYDKGRVSDGWRYLEAAPWETERKIEWSVRNTNVNDTQTSIGSGRENTRLIVEKFSEVSGEWDRAAQYCDELEYKGFDDWFLPSLDELNQMYGKLKRDNLGDFRTDDFYWSSAIGVWGLQLRAYAIGFVEGKISLPAYFFH
jgi:TolB-like protein